MGRGLFCLLGEEGEKERKEEKSSLHACVTYVAEDRPKSALRYPGCGAPVVPVWAESTSGLVPRSVGCESPGPSRSVVLNIINIINLNLP